MRADLYVYSDSFTYNGTDSELDILFKLSQFRDLTQRVPRSDNKFLFNTEEFLSTKILPDGTTCQDFFNRKEGLNKDIVFLFSYILTSGLFNNTTCTHKEIDEFLGEHDASSCSAKVVLSKESLHERSKQLLATYEDWRSFRSYFLGLYPGEVEYFYEECSKYYPNLILGKRYIKQTAEVLISHSQKITECLLNIDRYFMEEWRVSNCSNIMFPQMFASKYNMDGGSFEGKKDDKFKVCFEDKENSIKQIKICEPHFKFNTPDPSKDKELNINNYCRIYFCMPTDKSNKGQKIYIGAIVRHL